MNKKLISTHVEAASLLCKIKDEFRDMILSSQNIKSINETFARKFVRSKFRKYNLKTDKDAPIVAFNENTSQVHYFPNKKSSSLNKECLILLDMWAHLPNGVYADMTWMFYYGKRPSHLITSAFDAIIGARDSMISFIRNNLQDGHLPTANLCDANVRDYLNKKQLGSYFLHSTGHSMTQRLVHGLKSNKGISPRNNLKLKKMLPYTVEPGLYFGHLDRPFGVRTEMDFYINSKNEIIITSDAQKELDYILPKGQKRLDLF